MGVLTVIAGLLSILMPETRGIPLPEALSQVQNLNWYVSVRYTAVHHSHTVSLRCNFFSCNYYL